jgi:hypothetical protein
MGGVPVAQAVAPRGMGLFRYSIYYLGLLFAAIAADVLIAL